MRIAKERKTKNGSWWTDWAKPLMSQHLLGCCDCGLVHRLQFKVIDGQVYYRAQRAPGHTAAMRKRRNHNFVHRSAVTGRYVPGVYARRHPRTTTKERRNG